MVMGKKKPQKTKELSVAIAEASSTGTTYDDTTQQPQIQTPRKRGRPRKITKKTETSKEEIKLEEGAEGRAEEVSESSWKKGKTSSEVCVKEHHHHQQQQEGSSACTQSSKDPKGEPSRSSRARRKSKPRKSS